LLFEKDQLQLQSKKMKL